MLGVVRAASSFKRDVNKSNKPLTNVTNIQSVK